MAIEAEFINAAAVIIGGLIGSSALTLFPYFMDKGAVEKQQEAIRRKPETQRTDDEQYLLDMKYPGFMAEYKYRFFFGLLSGLGLTFAYLSSNVGSIGTLDTLQAMISGITTSGFLTAIADKIRSTTNVSAPVVAAVAAKESTTAPPINKVD